MSTVTKRRFFNVAAAFATILFLTGCASLTQSQIDEVNKFAKITENYNTLPPEIYRSYAEIYLIKKSMTIATKMQDNSAEITTATENYQKIIAKMQELEAALGVLKSYAKLLQNLSSSEFNENLAKEAVVLGEEIDNGIQLLNKQNQELNLDNFGTVAAAIVKGAGSIYIKHKQATALKKCVTGAEPDIEKITKSIVALCENMNIIIDQARDDIMDTYETLVKQGKLKNNPEEIEALIKLLVKADNIKEAAAACIKATEKYRQAHTKLFTVIKERKSLKDGIKEIMDLYEEIKKVQTLIQTIEEK